MNTEALHEQYVEAELYNDMDLEPYLLTLTRRAIYAVGLAA